MYNTQEEFAAAMQRIADKNAVAKQRLEALGFECDIGWTGEVEVVGPSPEKCPICQGPMTESECLDSGDWAIEFGIGCDECPGK